jgi:hypothetical protein
MKLINYITDDIAINGLKKIQYSKESTGPSEEFTPVRFLEGFVLLDL